MKLSRLFLIVVILSLTVIPVATASPNSTTPIPAPAQYDTPSSDTSLWFIENVGQFDARARFQVRGASGNFWLAEDALWLTLIEQPEPVIPAANTTRDTIALETPATYQAVNVRLSFVGANPYPHLEPFSHVDTAVHYYQGSEPDQWHTHVPVWGGVRYVDLYPGIDLELSEYQGQLTWGVVCHANCASAMQSVRLRIEGVESAMIEEDSVRLVTSVGEARLPLLTMAADIPHSAPTVSIIATQAFEIATPFSAATTSNNDLQWDYPETDFFSTYLGGSDWDYTYGIAVDGTGDLMDRNRVIYVTGATLSPTFPIVTSTVQLQGPVDAYIMRLRRVATLVRPEFFAYIGGEDQDSARGVAVDPSGNIYLTGYTASPDFPVTANAFDTTFNACLDCLQCNSKNDAFVIKMDSTGNLNYSTYFGGSYYYSPGFGNRCGYEFGQGIAVDVQGVVYMTGLTRSQNFPTTPNAFDTVFSNIDIGLNEDTFVVKLNPALSGAAGLLYSTYVGGGTISAGQAIAVDAHGYVYVTGRASSAPWGVNYFPVTTNAYDTNPNRGAYNDDIFIFKMDPAGNGAADLLYSTFIGTQDDQLLESGRAIALDAANHIYITGRTSSPYFPTTPGAFDTTCGTDGLCNNFSDAVIIKLNPASQGQGDLRYATYLGGNYNDEGNAIAVDANGDVYVTGAAGSDSGFPITPDAYDTTPSNYNDVFLTRLRLQGRGAADLIYSTFVHGSLNDAGNALVVDEDGRVYVAGDARSSNFPTTSRAFQPDSMGWQDGFAFRLVLPRYPDLSTSTKRVAPDRVSIGEVVTFTVYLINTGENDAPTVLTDTLPGILLLQGAPIANAGIPPSVNGQVITWSGTVTSAATVVITYTTMLTMTPPLTITAPVAFNTAEIHDGYGNVYLRHAFVNGYKTFLPIVYKQ